MTVDWIVGLLLVAVLFAVSCSMMGIGVIGALVRGRVTRCQRCGRLGLGQGDRPVHDGGCPELHAPSLRHHPFHLHH
jgi:hypothetical protein